MKVFAISDLHLSTTTDKPMDVFGGEWNNYEDKLFENWDNTVTDSDIVLLAGDLSWGMTLDEALPDLDIIGKHAGKKVIIRGNHDYWWKSIQTLREKLPTGMYAVQNDVLRIDNLIICGTRGWIIPEHGKTLSKADKKIYDRELIRLELSLSEMKKIRKDGDNVICMMHFPPFNNSRTSSEFTDLIEKYDVDTVVYGHVHGKRDTRGTHTRLNNVDYYLTSCDQVYNKLTLIKEL